MKMTSRARSAPLDGVYGKAAAAAYTRKRRPPASESPLSGLLPNAMGCCGPPLLCPTNFKQGERRAVMPDFCSAPLC